MNDQPIRLQRRHQSLDLHIEVSSCRTENQQHEAVYEGGNDADVAQAVKRKEDGNQHERTRDRELIHVCPGHARGGDAAHHNTGTVNQRAETEQSKADVFELGRDDRARALVARNVGEVPGENQERNRVNHHRRKDEDQRLLGEL